MLRNCFLRSRSYHPNHANYRIAKIVSGALAGARRSHTFTIHPIALSTRNLGVILRPYFTQFPRVLSERIARLESLPTRHSATTGDSRRDTTRRASPLSSLISAGMNLAPNRFSGTFPRRADSHVGAVLADVTASSHSIGGQNSRQSYTHPPLMCFLSRNEENKISPRAEYDYFLLSNSKFLIFSSFEFSANFFAKFSARLARKLNIFQIRYIYSILQFMKKGRLPRGNLYGAGGSPLNFSPHSYVTLYSGNRKEVSHSIPLDVTAGAFARLYRDSCGNVPSGWSLASVDAAADWCDDQKKRPDCDWLRVDHRNLRSTRALSANICPAVTRENTEALSSACGRTFCAKPALARSLLRYREQRATPNIGVRVEQYFDGVAWGVHYPVNATKRNAAIDPNEKSLSRGQGVLREKLIKVYGRIHSQA